MIISMVIIIIYYIHDNVLQAIVISDDKNDDTQGKVEVEVKIETEA